MPRPNGFIFYAGPSRLNGEPIVGVATGLVRRSDNEKTGPMVQVYFIPDPERAPLPHKAIESGADASVCGDCKYRDGGCYVVAFRGPLMVAKAVLAGSYPRVSLAEASTLLDGETVRLGAWGDPASVPTRVLRRLVSKARRWTGYSHAWTRFPSLRGLLMASVDTPAEFAEAQRRGWRTFRVDAEGTPMAGEIGCPAGPENGARTTCDKCGLCDGARASDGRRSIVIRSHGAAHKIKAANEALRSAAITV